MVNMEPLAKLTLFYLSFYSALLLFLSLVMAIFLYIVIDANYPELQGMDNLIKGNPGLGFRPIPDLETTLIRFVQGSKSSYKYHMDHIQAYLDQYDNDKQVGENFIDCSNKGKDLAQRNKVCRFNIDNLGHLCTWQQEYGYDEGQPCILIKFNQVYGWLPEPYNATEFPDTKLLGDRFSRDHIGITCEGENPADKENIGNITYWPRLGFPHYFFPYENQEGYRSPIVMVRFENPANGVVINVWCKAWAKNLYHHRIDQAGSVHFELLVD